MPTIKWLYTWINYTHIVPRFLILYYRWQLLVVSNQHKSLGIKQWSYADRLADLRGFIYDAEIKPATGKNGMFDAHTGGSHYKLVRGKRSTLLTQALNRDWKFAVFCFSLDISPPCCKAAPAVTESEPPSSEHFPLCMKQSQDEPDGMKEEGITVT